MIGGAIGSAIERPMLSVLGKLLGAIGFVATPSTLGDGSLVTSYKAPEANQVESILLNGFTAKDFPGEGAFFTLGPNVAAGYARMREAGMFVINTPVHTFNELSGRGLISVDPLETASFVVSPLGLSEFSTASTIEYVHQGSYRMIRDF